MSGGRAAPGAIGRLDIERLTLAVLMCGVASLALSDFVSPFYWSLSAAAAALRLIRGPGFALSEMQASLIGWAGFVWVGLELALGRALIVAFTDFLLILALAVVVEAPTPRNHLHRMLVGLFLVLASAVLTDSVLLVLPLAAFVVFLWRAAAALYGLHQPGGDLPPRPWASELGTMAGIAVMVAAVFFLMPRFEFGSRLKPTQPRMATSGFSDRVELGEFARSLDPTVVLRIEAPELEPHALRRLMAGRYWRGVVLSVFDGRGWRRLPAGARLAAAPGEDLRLKPGSGATLHVFREATDHPYLPLPDGLLALQRLPARATLDRDGVFAFAEEPSRRLKLNMVVAQARAPTANLRPPVPAEWETGRIPEALREWLKRRIPEGMAPAEALARIRDELAGWTYDLNAPIEDRDPIGSFLRLKRGHCELYATTLALIARLLGFPARVVNGYAHGEYNEIGGFFLFRQAHAHSWVEVWRDGAWRRMDPTPNARWGLSAVRFPGLDAVWESVRLAWYRYVLEFEDADRMRALGALVEWLRSARGLVPALAAALAVLLIARLILRSRPRGAWFRARDRRLAVLDRWLRRRGCLRPPSVPVSRLSAPAGIAPEDWAAFVRDWEAQAYRPGAGWSVRALRSRLRALARGR